jgi:hypothetical protein
MKRRIVTVLLRLYPAHWRAEYAQELASILGRRPLSAAAVFDTLRSAMLERVRVSEPWVLIGSLLFLLNFCASAINSIAPMPELAYGVYEWCMWIPLMVGICWMTLRGASLRQSIVAAVKIALLSNATDLLLLALWAAGMVHPRVIGLRGFPSRSGFDVAFLCFRSTLPVTVHASAFAWQVPAFLLMVATIYAIVWWTVVRVALRVRAMLAG